jgi:phage/plasmid-like protein (TIGR03299 family)
VRPGSSELYGAYSQQAQKGNPEMPHELHYENGKAAMFYVGQKPWHGLGTKLDHPATAAEAIEAAKLNWEVRKVPLFATADGITRSVDDQYAVVPAHKWKETECPIFGTVGSGYTPLQNRDAFHFFDGIVGAGAAIYETAGALGQGERVWMLAKLPTYLHVADGDIAEKYLLLSNSHDGLSSVQIRFTPVRVVCANTLGQALRERGHTIRVAHTSDMKERLEQARKNLKIIDTRYAQIETTFRQMVKVKMDNACLTMYMQVVFPDPADPDDQPAAERVFKSRKRATFLFENGAGNKLKSVEGTLWAAYNGVAELVDHGPTTRDAGRRMEHVVFGSGASVKVRAFEFAKKQMVGEWRP